MSLRASASDARPYDDAHDPAPLRIGEILIALGALDRPELARALRRQVANRSADPLGRILVSDGLVTERTLQAGLALQSGIPAVDVGPEMFDPGLVLPLGPDFCIRHRVVPLRREDGVTLVATGHPGDLEPVRPRLERALGPIRPALCPGDRLRAAVAKRFEAELVRLAESRPDAGLSARTWNPRRFAALMLALCASILGAFVVAPAIAIAALLGLSTLALIAISGLRAGALFSHWRSKPPPAALPDAPLPAISMLVPLLGEAAITDQLLVHLGAVDYPPDRLEILLVTEAGDEETGAVLDRAHNSLPDHICRVIVPPGTLRTKPRALNYALDFAQGEIIGVWDAEDAPAPDQLRIVAAAFAAAPDDVVCLQGRLEFYNASQNWLSRCFALDYAAWFRIVLPGLARMGFAIPLGGTTLFFRRQALEALGRWDAHNVTEDADLGIRLARAGWRTELIDTVTREEANCRPAAWVRQRTRWLKGYALTWAVHMRRPGLLWRQLGTKRFLGFQALFLGTFFLFLTAPLLWAMAFVALIAPHPLSGVIPTPALIGLAALFLLCEAVNLGTAAIAVAPRADRWLMKWVPTLVAYFPMGTIAAYRALFQSAAIPFFWEKTRHGLSQGQVRSSRRSPRSG